MTSRLTASVVIPNHNYGRFVGEAITSAITQRPRPQVVVVDDGSTDESRDVLRTFRDEVIVIEKSNTGQLATLNIGVEAATGDVIHILDADDTLLEGAVGAFLRVFEADPSTSKVHWPLRIIDAAGRDTGRRTPAGVLPSGELAGDIIAQGPDCYVTSPTSGNAWNRRLLDSVLPFPHRPGRASPDSYLSMLAPLHGPIGAIQSPLTLYRLHGANVKTSLTFDQLLDRNLELWEWRAVVLSAHLNERGVSADFDEWRRQSWVHRLDQARRDIRATIAAHEPFILVDDAQWAMPNNDTWRALPFLERGGFYWGPPADDVEAVVELERQLASGVRWVVVAWPAFWYLDHYPALVRALEAFPLAIRNENVLIFGARRS